MITRDGTKKILRSIIVLVIVGVISGYTYFSSKNYIEGPKISVFSPQNGTTIYEPSVEIVGQALRIQDITINGRPILIDEQGNFKETLLLLPGYNVSMINAVDKFGRNTEYKMELVYED